MRITPKEFNMHRQHPHAGRVPMTHEDMRRAHQHPHNPGPDPRNPGPYYQQPQPQQPDPRFVDPNVRQQYDPRYGDPRMTPQPDPRFMDPRMTPQPYPDPRLMSPYNNQMQPYPDPRLLPPTPDMSNSPGGFGRPGGVQPNPADLPSGPLLRTRRKRASTANIPEPIGRSVQYNRPTDDYLDDQSMVDAVDDLPLTEPGIVAIPVGDKIIYKGDSIMSQCDIKTNEPTDGGPMAPVPSMVLGDALYAGMKKLSIDAGAASVYQTIQAEYVLCFDNIEDSVVHKTLFEQGVTLDTIANGINTSNPTAVLMDNKLTEVTNLLLRGTGIGVESISVDHNDLNDLANDPTNNQDNRLIYANTLEHIKNLASSFVLVNDTSNIDTESDDVDTASKTTTCSVLVNETYIVMGDVSFLNDMEVGSIKYCTPESAPSLVDVAANTGDTVSQTFVLADSGKYLLVTIPAIDKIWIKKV